MLPPVDNLIKKYLKNHLHKKAELILKNGIEKHYKYFPDMGDAEKKDIENKYAAEKERVIAIADESLLIPRVLTGTLSFWFISLFWIVYTITRNNFKFEHIEAIFTPVIGALLVWIGNIATISYSYNGRMEGAMSSILAKIKFDKEHAVPNITTAEQTVINITTSEARALNSPSFFSCRSDEQIDGEEIQLSKMSF